MAEGPAPDLRVLRGGRARQTLDLSGHHTFLSMPESTAPGSGPYLDDLFLELLGLPEAKRSDAIPRLCGGDADLEAELRGLIDADAEANDAPLAPSPTLQAGQALDRYRLFKQLGKGASAAVWQAWDTHLRTWTALKVLKPDLVAARRDALDVVLHEARAASQIISDHVVRVREAGRLADGSCFVDMQLCAEYRPDLHGEEELVVGHALSKEVGGLSAVEAARLASEAARGVDAAHRVGVLHRDLKPANLLLQPVSRRVLVTDFGLAVAQIAPAAGPMTPATSTITVACDGPAGAIVGTPAWMAPEQARGEVPTRASDVYGLGATLYTLLTGEPPYRTRGPGRLGGAMDVLLQVRSGPPNPIAGPRRLVRIVERAMARDPADRYPTAGALAADLDRWVRDHPTSNEGARPLLRLGLAARRNRETTAALAILFIALAIFGAFVQQLEDRRQELLVAVNQAEGRRTTAQAAEARALTAQRDAEAARLNAESSQADAEAEADHAQGVQRQAEKDRQAAETARAAALVGQTEAEAHAAAEIKAREEAVQAKALAESAQHDMQGRLDTMATKMTEAEASRARTEIQLTASEAARKELEDRLSKEVGRRISAETARDVAVAERDRARAEIQAREAAALRPPPVPEPSEPVEAP